MWFLQINSVRSLHVFIRLGTRLDVRHIRGLFAVNKTDTDISDICPFTLPFCFCGPLIPLRFPIRPPPP